MQGTGYRCRYSYTVAHVHTHSCSDSLSHVGFLRFVDSQVCAGTECPRLVLGWLEEAVKTELDPEFGEASFEVNHVLSSEMDASKRNFIRKMCKPEKLFGNAAVLSSKDAPNYASEDKSSWATVPESDIVVAGFPCKDVSRLNPLARQHTAVVASMSGKTGTAFEAILNYQARWTGGGPPEDQGVQQKTLQRTSSGAITIRGKLGLYENVKGLTSAPTQADGSKGTIYESNLAVCLAQLSEKLGQVAYAFELDPRSYGHPQSRPRVWIPSFDKELLDDLNLAPDALWNSLKATLVKISNGYGIVPVEAL